MQYRSVQKIAFFFALFFFAPILFAQKYQFAQTIPSLADNRLDEISSVAASPNKSYFIADPGSSAIYEYDSTGKAVGELREFTVGAEKIRLKEPVSIKIGINGAMYILDKGLGKIIVRQADGSVTSFGEKDSDPGGFDDPISFAIDASGFVFVLSAGTNRVDIFTPQGVFQSWINGSSANFNRPIAIGINSANDLYVLDREGPQVHVFLSGGAHAFSSHLNLKGAAIGFANDIAVFPNGDYCVLDRDNCKIVHCNKFGNILGSMGSKGASSKGVFEKAMNLSFSPILPSSLFIVDVKAKIVQQFTIQLLPSELTPPTARLPISLTSAEFPAFTEMVVAANDIRYIIPADNKTVALGFKTGESKPFQRLSAEEAVSLAVDADYNVYVLDGDRQEVVMYDKDGVVVRRFGQENLEKLRKASSVAITPEGNALVADKKTSSVKRWNKQGVFEGNIIYEVAKVMKSPRKIQTDSKGQIYIWDDDFNAIARFSADGKQFSTPSLQLRSMNAAENTGEILGFFIDALDYIHVFNGTTKQYEVFEWRESPNCILRYGRPGKGDFGLSEVRAIGYDPSSATAYLSGDKKGGVRGILLPFRDDFGNGNRLFAQGNYDESLKAYVSGLQQRGNPQKLRLFVATRFAELGAKLVGQFETEKSLAYLRKANELQPNDDDILAALANGYAALFQKLSNEENYDELLVNIEKCRQSESPKLKDYLLQPLDALAGSLVASVDNELRIRSAIRVYNKLMEWLGANSRLYLGLANSYRQLYIYRKNIGASALELQVKIGELEALARTASRGFTEKERDYYSAQLLYLWTLSESKKHDEVIRICVEELRKEGITLQAGDAIELRKLLAHSYDESDKFDQAAGEYERLSLAVPSNKEFKMQYANVLAEGGKYDNAKDIYQQLLAENRDNPLLIGSIGRVELLRKNYAEASFQLEKAIRLDPNLRDFYGYLGEAFEGDGKFQQALANYRAAAQFKQQQYAQAKARAISVGELAGIQNDLSRYLTAIGNIHQQLGRHIEAIQAFREVLAINDGNALIWADLGKAYLNSGLVYDALNALGKAQKINPASQEISSVLASAIALREDITKNSPPVEIKEFVMDDLFPSLYRNYDDISVQPIGQAILANNTPLPISNVRISLMTDSYMKSPTPQQQSSLVGFANTPIRLAALFDENILENSETRKIQATLVARYTFEGKERETQKAITFNLHGRNAISWKDKRRLAAYVSAGNTPIVEYVKKIEVAFHSAPTYDLPVAIAQAIQIFTVLKKNNFTYSPDPNVSFAVASSQADILDYLQYPAETLMRKSGDCDDLVTVYCQLLESEGLNVAYIDVPGHVMMAFDTRIDPNNLSAAGIDPKDVIISGDKTWLPVETTLVGTQDFSVAWRAAAQRYYKELSENHFPEVISLADARKIYHPSTFVPKNFSPQMPEVGELLKSYAQQAKAIAERLSQDVVKTLEERRAAEMGNVFVRNKLAQIYARLGEFDKAEATLYEVYVLTPDNPKVSNNFGNLYYVKGDFKRAVAAFQKSIELDNSDADVFINLCKALLATGDKKSARQQFDEAIRLRPDFESAYKELKSKL